MRILITGAGGMVGAALLAHDRASLDITRAADVGEAFARGRPEAVVNCAAWTDVDGCERDPDRARLVNSGAVEILARESRGVGASFVTISTDYVFRGDREGFYTQRDDPEPQSAYGRAKLEGERRAQTATARCAVVRTGWIFGPGGRNFLARVVELARAGADLKAINDSYGTPTYAPHLAARLRELAALDLPGVYHVTNAGDGASFYDFSVEAARLAGCDESRIEGVSMDSLAR